MRMYDIIAKKRDGCALSEEEIKYFIKGYVGGDIPDYQASALMMAIYLRGMNDEETVILTREMAHSGKMLDLSVFGDKSVDKHSTGGVGDKTSLVVTPIVASLGLKVAKMSGRGLGHTGGTIDKLESIKDFRVTLSGDEFINIADKVGVVITGAGEGLDPADKKLYALRDVTATVGCIPLIVSSIMSKKLAGGAKSIVLDVKCGSGSFMKTPENARELATKMVKIGKANGRNVTAVITNMDKPLGKEIGNECEVLEAVKLLRGEEYDEEFKNVCVRLASELVAMGKGITVSESEALVKESLSSGKAYDKFLEWIKAQSGDISVFDKNSSYAEAKYSYELKSEKSGYLTHTDTASIGISAMMLGAGRASKEDAIDYSAGITVLKKTGDYVEKGETLAVLRSSTVIDCAPAAEKYLSALDFGETAPEDLPTVFEVIRGENI